MYEAVIPGNSLSPPQRSFARLRKNARGLGRGKIKARGDRWERKSEKGGSSHRSRATVFSLQRFFLSLVFTNKSLCGGERGGVVFTHCKCPNFWELTE